MGKTPNYIQERRKSAQLKEQSEKNERHLASIDRIADALENTQIKTKPMMTTAPLERSLLYCFSFSRFFLLVGPHYILFDVGRLHENASNQLKRLDDQLKLMADSSKQTDVQIAVNKDLTSAAKEQATAVRDNAEATRKNIVEASRAWVGPRMEEPSTPLQ